MLSNNGGFRYTPYSKPNQFDMFEYKVVCPGAPPAVATVYLAAPPVAVDDHYPQAPSGPTVIPASKGVLINDTVPCGSAVTVEVTSLPTHGEITRIQSDGSFTYEALPDAPAANDEFRYRLSCGDLSSDATVYLQAPPAAVDDTYLQSDSGPTVILSPQGILVNDTVPCGKAVQVSVVTPPSTGSLVSLVSDGSFTYESSNPASDDSFVYRLTCGDLSADATVFMKAPFPPPPPPPPSPPPPPPPPTNPVVFGYGACPANSYITGACSTSGPPKTDLWCQSQPPAATSGTVIPANTPITLDSRTEISFNVSMTIRELTSQNSRINANNLFLMSDVGTVDVKMSINSKDPADRVVGVAFIPAYTLPAGTNAVKKDQGFFNKCCSENVPDAVNVDVGSPYEGLWSVDTPPGSENGACPQQTSPCPDCPTGVCSPLWFYSYVAGTETATMLELPFPQFAYFTHWLQNADAAQPARSALQPDMSVVHCDFSIPPQSPINSLGLKYSVGGAGSPWMQFYSNTCPTGKKATPIMHSKQSAATSKPVTGGSHRGGVSGSAARVRHG